MDRMTPPEGCHPYREQIGAFLLGKLDGGELEAMQAHLDGCPVCRAEVRELEPVVAALADADPDRIAGDPRPPGDLEESPSAPILGEIHRAQSRRRGYGWSAVAAAAGLRRLNGPRRGKLASGPERTHWIERSPRTLGTERRRSGSG